MRKVKLLTVFILGHLFSSLYAQWLTYPYVGVLPMEGEPVTIYLDSTMTQVYRVLSPEDFEHMSVDVSIRNSSSDMFGDKIWIYLYEEGYVPEFTGWVEKKHCFRRLKIDGDNCSYIYARPAKDAPCMQILSNRGLLVNVIDCSSDWLKVRFTYHRVIEGWVRKDMLKP